MAQASRIFVSNRALGYVSNEVPCITRYIKTRQEHVIVTCVGRSLHTYNLSRLILLAVSDSTDEDITCLAGDSNVTFTAAGNKIQTWKRGTEIVQTYVGHEHPIHLLLPFGAHLVSVDNGNIVKVWDRNTKEVFLELTFDDSTFRITTLAHPSTYLNKVLFGSEQGRLQLWNLKTSKLIYTFDGWNSPITVLEQAPAIDVMAVGLNDGRIILHNLKYDETVMQFTQDWGTVTSISFRTDGEPIMVTASTIGHIVFWNLEERKVASQILEAHNGTVSCVKCFSNDKLMVTSSPDNSVKIWIFDQSDQSGRVLRLREGHAAPPTCARFHGHEGATILSAGSDSSLRVFNTVTEVANYSMGKAYYDRKKAKKKKGLDKPSLMPPIVEFTTEVTREKEWDNIAAIHLGRPVVTTWSFDKKKMGDLKLLPERWVKESRATLNVVASSICLTTCGNFVVVGYNTGHVDRFNIQSGIHRCVYGVPTAHKGAVRGVIIDPLNQFVITGCSNGLIKFWPFKAPIGTNTCQKPIKKIAMEDGIKFFRMHKENSLVGVVTDDFIIRLIDIETHKIVRTFTGHTGPILDATFSPDARWIISASMDCCIFVWDVPTASLIDCFKVHSPCSSLSFSPTGQYLATTHVNNLGIYLWSNRTLFSHVSLRAIKLNEIPLMDLPKTTGADSVVILEDEPDGYFEDETAEENSHKQIEDLITLSNLPSSRWLNLLDLDIIKQRNKPKEPPVAPKAAPFFLPTLPSLDLQFDFSSAVAIEDGVKTLRLEKLQNYTAFGRMLEKTIETEDFTEPIGKLKSMGPSAIDLEVNSLGLETQGSDMLMLQFMKMINYLLLTNTDFELAQSYLALFLRVHGTTVASTPILHEYLQSIKESQLKGWEVLQNNLMYCMCVVDSLIK